MNGTNILMACLTAYFIIYVLIQILNFYGIGQDVYGIYLAFLIFLILNSFILPTKNAKV
jgi:hypothetical protein